MGISTARKIRNFFRGLFNGLNSNDAGKQNNITFWMPQFVSDAKMSAIKLELEAETLRRVAILLEMANKAAKSAKLGGSQ